VCASNSNTAAAPWQEQADRSSAKSTGEGSRTTTGHPLPFSALPHQLRRDLRGNQTAISLAAALLEYARTKPYCYPTTARLADDLGVCQNTVRAALRALQSAGWIRIVLGANQPNGRRIWLTWLEPAYSGITGAPTRTTMHECTFDTVKGTLTNEAGAREAGRLSDPLQLVGAPLQATGATLQPAAVPLQPSAAEIRMSEEFNERNVVPPIHPDTTITSYTTPPATPLPLPRAGQPPAPPDSTPLPAPTPAHVAASATPPATTPTPASGPVRPLKEELAAVGPTTTPGDVRRLAARLCAALHDAGSLGGYIAAICKVVAGTLSRDRLLAAYQAGLKSVGKAARPGAVFQWTLANWTPPPKPSEIRYYQTPSRAHSAAGPVQCMAGAGAAIGCSTSAAGATPSPGAASTGTHVPEPAPTEADLAALREYAGNPRHPLRNVARRRLEELGLQ
jgi:hypothetical protein